MKTAIVTGGSGGIGQEICRRLAADGMRVVVHFGSNKAAADEVVESIKADGGSAIAVSAKVSDESEIKQLFQTAANEFDGVDIVVANAGVAGRGAVADTELDEFQRVMEINLRGAFLTLREAARRLRDNGRIVFISSQLADHPMEGTGIYSASKAAMDAVVVSMSRELGSLGITVNSVRPGATVPGMFGDSDEQRKEQFREMSPFKRLGKPEDIASVVSFLASGDGEWMTGQHLTANGGATS